MLTVAEVMAILEQLTGVHQLVVQLLYGSGLRLREGLTLWVKDLDFAQRQIGIRDTKGHESRVTMLPLRNQWEAKVAALKLDEAFARICQMSEVYFVVHRDIVH